MAMYNPPEDTGWRGDRTRGASMGRSNSGGYVDRDGDYHELAVLPHAAPFRLVRVRMVDGGAYDSGGAYWGCGDPLYYFESPISDINGYVRGRTREDAKQAVRAIHPEARFFR